ncbi:MAG: acyl-CoA dehydrogenase family protein [Pseudomonadota bacterium]
MNPESELESDRRELCAFLDRELTETIRRQVPLDGGMGPEAREFALKLGAAGWIGKAWPVEYGGGGGSVSDEIMLVEEFAKRGGCMPNPIARFCCGPVILRRGAEEMKQSFLPRIARGEIEFALGYTEPGAGSDLASMRMQVEDAGDHFVISGQKIYQTESHYADYHWLAARTAPEAGHRGISLFIVDQNDPRIEIQPMNTLGGERTNTVFYDEVPVPKSRLVGELNRGFYYMVEALDFERLTLVLNAQLQPVFAELIEYVKTHGRHGRPLAEDDSVRRRLAQMAIELDVVSAVEQHAYTLIEDDKPLDFEASIAKLLGSELRQRFAYSGLDILGNRGRLERDFPTAPLQGELAHLSRASVLDTIGGGTSEIMRNTIAARALEMPQS